MGEIINSRTSESTEKTPINAPMRQLVLGEKVASNTGDRRARLFDDEDILDLAKKVGKVIRDLVYYIML